MARSDIIISLIRAGISGDRRAFQKTAEALVAEERAKHHTVLADRLDQELHRVNGQRTSAAYQAVGGDTGLSSVHDMLYEVTPQRRLDDLLLPNNVAATCEELIEEHHRRDLLRSHNLAPRHRILFTGPPGNGKTTLAEALAETLMVPFLVVRYEGLIGSYLGETASRLRKLFDHVRSRPCLLFFDEFDTLGKERGDTHDTGEIKRVVSSLLLQVDSLPPHVLVVTATNHPELLDRAVWRRFQVRVELPLPSRAQIAAYLERAEEWLSISFELSPRTLADKLQGANYAELEEFVADVARRSVLSGPDASMKKIIRSRLAQWRERVRP